MHNPTMIRWRLQISLRRISVLFCNAHDNRSSDVHPVPNISYLKCRALYDCIITFNPLERSIFGWFGFTSFLTIQLKRPYTSYKRAEQYLLLCIFKLIRTIESFIDQFLCLPQASSTGTPWSPRRCPCRWFCPSLIRSTPCTPGPPAQTCRTCCCSLWTNSRTCP